MRKEKVNLTNNAYSAKLLLWNFTEKLNSLSLKFRNIFWCNFVERHTDKHSLILVRFIQKTLSFYTDASLFLIFQFM